jgi:hypothetical protein
MIPTTEKGLTLLETLIALSLLGFGILAVAPMFIYASSANEVGADYGTLGALAVDRMERLRELDFRDPRLAEGGGLTENVSTDFDYFDDSGSDGIVRWEIIDNITPPRTKTLRVRTVSRRVTLGLPKEIVLATVRGR